MKSKLGFTLVELLVVIAIISILAAIVVPKVQGHLLRTRMTKCEAEIRTIETSLVKLLTDSNRTNFKDLFTRDGNAAGTEYNDTFAPPLGYAEVETQIRKQTDLIYRLLRQGRNAELPAGVSFAPGVREKLGTSYLADIDVDGFQQLYQFYIGPWEPADSTLNTAQAIIPFRGWRANDATNANGVIDRTDPEYTAYVYNGQHKLDEEARVPGNPKADDAPGYPAPKDLSVYIFSRGVNLRSDQNYMLITSPGLVQESHKGGGDDINNWDKTRGWEAFYAG